LFLIDCLFKGTFHSSLYDRSKKTDDTVIQLKNTIIKIIKFVCFEKQYYMIVRKIMIAPIKDNVPMSHLMRIIKKEKNIIVTSIKQKMIFIDVKNVMYAHCQIQLRFNKRSHIL